MVNTFCVHYGLTPALVNDMYAGLKSIVNTEGHHEKRTDEPRSPQS